MGVAVAGATTPHNIPMNRQCSAYAADEVFATSTSGIDARLTWNSSRLWGAAKELDSYDTMTVAFDLDPGVNDGSTASFDGISFDPAHEPDYIGRWAPSIFPFPAQWFQRIGNSFQENTSATTNAGSADAANSDCGTAFAENQFERTNFTGGDVSGLSEADDVGVRIWLVHIADGTVYGSMPLGNPTGAPPLTFPSEVVCPTTDGLRSPNVYCPATGLPTAVELAFFAATGRQITWRLASQHDLFGFVLWRNAQSLTPTPILAQPTLSGGTYRFFDRNARRGVSYTYRLQAIRLSGSRVWLGSTRS
jgi:hypothetical protein